MLQRDALNILKLGHNVYLTGAAGSGKTYVLNEFIKYLHEHGIVAGVTASTGIAATHMGGMTIHSWAGIGISEHLSKAELDKLKTKSKLKKRMSETKVLIIDEVSMLHGTRLDLVDTVCRAFKEADKPFGGLQVILSGDLFQLPPVSRGGQPDFVFTSSAWQTMNLKVCYLTEQHRQEDNRLLDILGAIRSSGVDDSHFEHLEQRKQQPPAAREIVRLYTHNEAVDQINDEKLAELDGDSKVFTMTQTGNKRAAETLKAGCLAPETLTLKKGAEVMFVANSQTGQFVNGTLGHVAAFTNEGLPVVNTKQGTIYVDQHSWKMQDGERTVAEINQLPLRLAWAITVHKSQGMSLDAAEVDLSRSFEPGMGYVALSRVRDLDGLYIKGINNIAMQVHPEISHLDRKLRSLSSKAEQSIAAIDQASLSMHHKTVQSALQSDIDKLLANYDEALLLSLKKWRANLAKEKSVPAYVIFSDQTLKLIAAIKPLTIAELSAIKGIGPQKLEQYGDAVLDAVAAE